MVTPSRTLWTVLTTNMPRDQWLDIRELYKIVEINFNRFTQDDFVNSAPYNKEETWRRNLRNALQRRKDRGKILWDGNARYKLNRPYVWQMIKEAIDTINGPISYTEIKDYINKKWPNENQKTITAQIIVLTVNHESRIHYPENHKPRLTNSNSNYDLLFTIGRGRVEKYNFHKHGVWEIYKSENGKLGIRRFKIFTPSDIIWIKNVTNKEGGHAYMNLSADEFILHFPNKHGKSANLLKPKINDLILIRQKINGVPAFTHLVTPIDNDRVEENNRTDYRYGRRVKVIAKTDLTNFIPVSSTSWKRVRFPGIAQGNVCEIKNVKSIGDIDELLINIWNSFSKYFLVREEQSVIVTSALLNEIETFNPDIKSKEGKLRLVRHFIRERNAEIVKHKKQQAIKNNNLKCEVCTFSFENKYNKTFIECHHIIPIGQTEVEERETTLDDLALVCSNCHRMLHIKFDAKYLTIAQLRKRIELLAP